MSSPNHRPEEQFESHFVSVEMRCSLIRINPIDVDGADGEGQIHDDEDKQKHQNVQDHVWDADDHGTSLAPHQASLEIYKK